jgi:predicted amidohydrolase
MIIALVSLDQKWLDKKNNFSRCEALVDEASKHGAELVVFPEMTLTGFSMDMTVVAESEKESDTLSLFGELARTAGVTIVFGACLIDLETGNPRNQFCLALPDGSSAAIYAKIHPFSFAGEDKVLELGSENVVVSVGALRFGASICYDLRFPEMYSAMSASCNSAIVIANWPAKRIAHWKTLLTARAIENQFYAFGVNRIGTDGNGLIYEKSTLAISPEGYLLTPIFSGDELDIFNIDIDSVARYREEFPTVRDKRYPLYLKFFGGKNATN